ncbi:hypothetical protein ET464_06240 [Paenibacillus protaetiae]|uniref:Methyltransferase n=2 Tax=Paenibacillus protaetiae TaxID=2509456 RepID=A0A4P6EZ71_9BACL|nr:hypothetical protein ET464_06240 [Paenibacillus protaetiae]
MTQLNNQRKKQGKEQVVTGGDKSDRYYGRSIILPVFLLFFIGIYLITSLISGVTFRTIEWITVAAYIVMALVFFLRRPYLKIGKDYVQTRRMTGDKRINASGIKSITVQDGSILIEQVKGANWMFNRLLNRYPTAVIAERLKEFAKVNHINLIEK